MDRIPNPILRQILFILIIIGLGGVIFWKLKFFMSAVLGAYTLYVLLTPPMALLTDRWNWSRTAAALVLMLLSFVVLFVPFAFFLRLLNEKMMEVVTNLPAILAELQHKAKGMEYKTGMDMFSQDNLQELNNWLLVQSRMVLRALMNWTATIATMYFVLYFMLKKGRELGNDFFSWLPLKENNVLYVRRQLHTLVYSNAVGIPLMALLQGFTGLLGYWVAGVEDPFFWFILTCGAGLIPIVGVALAYVPLCIVIYLQGNTGTAIVLFLYGAIVIASIDNFGRMWLQHKLGNTHPLITLAGVICGVKLFGFIGFIFGPILVAFLLLLLRLYSKEYLQKPPPVEEPVATT